MQTYTIGITGGSGSGKTTFIEHLRQSFSDREVCIISQDDYYRQRDKQFTDEQGVKNFDKPDSIDKKAFAKDIRTLLAGKPIQRLEYTFNNDNKVPKTLVFNPAPILIVEGIFVFHYKKIRKLLDLKVFLHAKENLKVIRRIKRDRVERNYPLDDVLYRYENHVLPTFEKYILPYK
ncbi:MAG: uridine kinase, partial [Saprospiraceae bacterium]